MEQRGPSRQQEDQQPVAKRPCSRQDEEVADEEEMAGAWPSAACFPLCAAWRHYGGVQAHPSDPSRQAV